MEDKLGRHMKEMCGELGEKYMKSILSEIKALSEKEKEQTLKKLERGFKQEELDTNKQRVNRTSDDMITEEEFPLGDYEEVGYTPTRKSSYQKLKKKFDTTLMGIKKLYKAFDKLAAANGISLGSKHIGSKAKKKKKSETQLRNELMGERDYREKLGMDAHNNQNPTPRGFQSMRENQGQSIHRTNNLIDELDNLLPDN